MLRFGSRVEARTGRRHRVTIRLYPYQVEGDEAVAAAHVRGIQRPAVVAATGAGKSIMIATRAQRYLRQHGGRALVIAHRIELIEQNAQELIDVAPGLNVGIVKASRNETRADVISASVQTLAGERRRQMIADVSLVIVDECHRAAAPSYLALLNHYGCYTPGGAAAVGYTATMTRSDGKALGDVWQEIVYTKDIASLVRDGYLCRPRGLRVRVQDFDPTKVKLKGGDYDDEAMGEAIEQSLVPEKIAEAILEHAKDRKIVLFAPTVHSAGVIRDALLDAGISAVAVSADTPKDERRALRADSEAGRVQVACNVGLYTEGTNWPWIDCVVLASLTRHKGTFIQKAGRGLRTYPGKTDCLIMMIGGAAAGHSLMAPVELFGESVEEIERDPCNCHGWSEATGDCECGRRKCLPECPCGGGGQWCGCPRPTDEELIEDDELDEGVESLGATGPLVSAEVDLFAGSKTAWAQTPARIWYLSVGERLIAIVPGDPGGKGGYDVVSMTADGRPDAHGRTSWWIARGVSEMAYAMAHAEGDVTEPEHTLARKGAGWRRDAPSEAQKYTARRWGILVNDLMTKGEVSALISQAKATHRIDSRIPTYARQQLVGAR